MANYPSSIVQEQSSKEPWRDPMELDYARSGGAKGRRLQAAKKRQFMVTHRHVTTAQRATLEAFYDANRSVTFTFAWNDAPATTYTVIFADKDGLDWDRDGPILWRVTVKLAEV